MGFGAVLLHKELGLNNMDNHFSKDDKTRIGGFNAPPPADGRPPEVNQGPPPSPNPFWQSSPPAEALPPAAAPPAAEPYQPPAQAAAPAWPPPPVVEPYSPPPVAEPYRPPPAAAPAWPPPPAAEPYQPPSQPAAEPYRPPPQPVVEPYRPPQQAEPYRPPQPAADLYQLSSQQDDMWFVVDLPGNAIRFPLRFGEVITLGRDGGQNIVIDDKTLSRNHLLLQRNGDRITVQVLGLNGLVYANQIHKSTTIEVAVPATLTIGNVACKIEKKFDTDATVLMNNPASAAQQRPGAGAPAQSGAFASRPASPAYPTPAAQPWGESQPFSAAPPEGDKFPFPSNQPIPPVFQAGQQAPGFPPPSYTPPSFDFGPNDPPPGGGSRAGSAYETPSVYGGGEKPKGNKNLLFIGGGIGAAVLVVGIGLFFWLKSPAPVKTPPPPAAVALPVVPLAQPAASGCASGQGTNNLYAKYLSKAKVFLQEGNKKDACDYLKDIPQSSACWAEAVELAKKIEDCRIE